MQRHINSDVSSFFSNRFSNEICTAKKDWKMCELNADKPDECEKNKKFCKRREGLRECGIKKFKMFMKTRYEKQFLGKVFIIKFSKCQKESRK